VGGEGKGAIMTVVRSLVS